jgi:hypothetical protein
MINKYDVLSRLEKIHEELTGGHWSPGVWRYKVIDNKLTYTHIEQQSPEDASITVATAIPQNMSEIVSVVSGCGCCGSPFGAASDAVNICLLRNELPDIIEVLKELIGDVAE